MVLTTMTRTSSPATLESRRVGVVLVYLYRARIVGMQACGDVMIGHHGRSVHEAIPRICGAKAIPTSLLLHPSPRNKIVNQSNQRLSDYLTSSMTLLLVVTLTY